MDRWLSYGCVFALRGPPVRGGWNIPGRKIYDSDKRCRAYPRVKQGGGTTRLSNHKEIKDLGLAFSFNRQIHTSARNGTPCIGCRRQFVMPPAYGQPRHLGQKLCIHSTCWVNSYWGRAPFTCCYFVQPPPFYIDPTSCPNCLGLFLRADP